MNIKDQLNIGVLHIVCGVRIKCQTYIIRNLIGIIYSLLLIGYNFNELIAIFFFVIFNDSSSNNLTNKIYKLSKDIFHLLLFGTISWKLLSISITDLKLIQKYTLQFKWQVSSLQMQLYTENLWTNKNIFRPRPV